MLINGEWQTDTPTFPVFNPATGEEIGQVANGTEQDAARAIDAASAALPAWMNETAYARSAVLYRAYQLMLEQQRVAARALAGRRDTTPLTGHRRSRSSKRAVRRSPHQWRAQRLAQCHWQPGQFPPPSQD